MVNKKYIDREKKVVEQTSYKALELEEWANKNLSLALSVYEEILKDDSTDLIRKKSTADTVIAVATKSMSNRLGGQYLTMEDIKELSNKNPLDNKPILSLVYSEESGDKKTGTSN